MTKIYVDYDKEACVPRPPDGEFEDTIWTFNDATLSTEMDPWWQRSYEFDYDVGVGDTIWLTIAVWLTKDEFGYDENSNMNVIGGFKTQEEAESLANDLRNNLDPDYSTDETTWFPWQMHDSWIDYIEVKKFIVKP